MHTEIPKPADLAKQVFSIESPAQFEGLALQVFRFQYYTNSVYQHYCKLLKRYPGSVSSLTQIAFLPISFFKTHTVLSSTDKPQTFFESSGTTGLNTSKHHIINENLYQQSFSKAFNLFYGDIKNFCIIGLLPSYLERNTSSLVYMVQDLINKSGHPESGFYLYDFKKLANTLTRLENAGQKTLLIGVTYALLQFAEEYPRPLHHTIIMETGGMKGRKKEMLREEVHAQIKAAFSLNSVHSEYGMTELLSQAYAAKEGRFYAPPWMKVLIREEDDPLSIANMNKTGGLNVIDLANIYSCSFIATEDVGKVNKDGSFEVAGRLDNAAIRGCSLLYI